MVEMSEWYAVISWRKERSIVFFFQAKAGIRDIGVTGVQTCALPIWARLFAPGSLCSDGPFPEHYEPMESPVHNGLSKTQNDPAVHIYKDAKDTFAAVDSEFPYVATTYRVTEHEHFVTQNVPYLVEAMPDFFIELPVELAEEKGITNGGKVKVRSKRGEVVGVALVTKRM